MFRRKSRYSYSSYGSSRGRSYGGYGRKRVNWGNVLPVVLGVLVVLIIVIVFNFSRIRLAFKGYSWSEQSAILELTSDKIAMIIDDDKMDHITDWLELSKNVSYYDEYEKYYSYHKDTELKTIVSTVDTIFDNYVPSLKEIGYSTKQIWTVLKTASVDDLAYLVDKQYSYDTIKPYMAVKGFTYQDMAKYIKLYAKKKNYNYAVLYTTYPQIISTNSSETTYTITDPEASYTTLVKKGFALKSDYVPSDLVTPEEKYVSYGKWADSTVDADDSMKNYRLRQECYDAFVDMYEAAEKLDYHILIRSGYRSYKKQQETYDMYEEKYGGIYAQEHVALPGQSEHQTGLGIDMTSQSVVDGDRLVFGDTAEYKWVCENCYKYGFILRFADGTSDITGITQEPWHFRYVGKEAAKIIYENNWTLEEYVLYEGDLPDLTKA